MIVDAHAHVGVRWPELEVRLSLADTVSMMDRANIAKACTSASRFLRSDFHVGNRVTLDVVRSYPDRFIGFVIANPRHQRQSLEEIDLYLGEHGFKGIKVHRSHTGVDYDDERYDPIYAKAEDYGVPVLAHVFNVGEVRQLAVAATSFPEVAFIFGHSGGYEWPDCLEMIGSLPNAYFDICASCTDLGRVEAFVQAGGAERVLFGTDAPFLEPAHCLAQVLAACISEEGRRLILGGNILRLMGEDCENI